MSELCINAFAKINLTLEVVRRRPDGYHDLRTVFQQVGLCDEVILSSGKNGIHLTCDDPTLSVGADNLTWRAAALIRDRFRPADGVRVHLRKRIPIGGGLAGGSADAAATIMGCNQLWQLGLTQSEMMALGGQLGMDVPFCIMGGTALGAGRGDELQQLTRLAGACIVVAFPGVCSSTADAYATLQSHQFGDTGATDRMAAAIERGDMPAVAVGLYNVFEHNVFGRLPAIAKAKQLMLEGGAWNACMTGSGACVFALTRTQREAEAVAEAVRRSFPLVFVTHTC